MLVSALMLGGWAASDRDDGLAPCLLAAAMGQQNGMLTKHAHAVVRTTHMTGLTTDIGVLLGHQVSRQAHRLALTLRGTSDPEEKLTATRKTVADEWTQLKLLSASAPRTWPSCPVPLPFPLALFARAPRTPASLAFSRPMEHLSRRRAAGLLFVAFFTGGVGGRALFRARGADALLLPACGEAIMGFGYGLYRRWLRPGWKRSRLNARARCELQVQTSSRSTKASAGETREGAQEGAASPDAATHPEHIMVVEEDEQLDPYPINDTDDERRPLSPRPGRCRVHSSPAKSRKMQSGLREQPAAPEF